MISDTKKESILTNWIKEKSGIAQKINEILVDIGKELSVVFEKAYDKDEVMELLKNKPITYYNTQNNTLEGEWRKFVYDKMGSNYSRIASLTLKSPKAESALPHICDPFDAKDPFIVENPIICEKIIKYRNTLKNLLYELTRELTDINNVISDENITFEHIKKYSSKLCQ